MSTLIEAQGVGVWRAGRWLIHDIDFLINSGEVITLIGPNGGGKSTLLKTLLGLIQPNTGTVKRHTSRIGYAPPADPQQFDLPMTVRRMMSLTSRLNDPAMHAALNETGADHLLDSQIKALSHGELQRVMVARALSLDPDLLVMDEPMRGVDFASEADLYHMIMRIVEHRQCALLLTSHDLHYVMSRTTRVICLSGTVRCAGTLYETVDNPAFRQMFGNRADAYQHVRHHCQSNHQSS